MTSLCLTGFLEKTLKPPQFIIPAPFPRDSSLDVQNSMKEFLQLLITEMMDLIFAAWMTRICIIWVHPE